MEAVGRIANPSYKTATPAGETLWPRRANAQ
jgi:hypothetical protein